MTTAPNANGRNLPAVMQTEQIDYGDASRPVVRYTLGDMQEIARTAANSGMFPMNAAQIMTLMLICEAEGLHPVQAMRRFHIIEGRPSMRADAMQAEFQRHGGRIHWIRSTSDECEAEFSHPKYQPDPFTVRVTLKELMDSGVAMGKWDEKQNRRVLKDNYRKHPRSMLRARVISEGVRAVDPGVVVGIYTPEEVEDMRPASAESPAVERSPSRLRNALDAARRPQAVEATSEPAPPRTPFGEWLDAQIADANEQWSAAARQAGVDPGEPINRPQVINAIVSGWIEEGSLAPEAVTRDGTPDGKRDKGKATRVFLASVEKDAEDTKEEVLGYLKHKLIALAEEAGTGRRDDTPDEAAAMADDDPPEAGSE